MALRAVIDHPKFFRLKILLGLSKASCLGQLETLWHFCGRFTPDGNIGKYSNDEIEAWLEWDGEPGRLLKALSTSGWIDDDPVHGFIVHDWHKHCDQATRKTLARLKMDFVLPTCCNAVLTVSGQRPDKNGQFPKSAGNSPNLSGLPGSGSGSGSGSGPGPGSGAGSGKGACDFVALPPPSDKGVPMKRPSVAEVVAYGERIGLSEVECRRFHDHFEANGWKVGRTPMVSWQAAARNWLRNVVSGTYGPPQPRSRGTPAERLAAADAILGHEGGIFGKP